MALGIILLIIGGILLFNIGGIRDNLNIQGINLPTLGNLSPRQTAKAISLGFLSPQFIEPKSLITQSGAFIQQVDELGRPVPTFDTGF